MAAARVTHCIAHRNLAIGVNQARHTFTGRVPQAASSCLVNHTAKWIEGLKEQQMFYVRQFHTSQQLAAAGDDSTIDFAYLPSTAVEAEEDEFLRVPIMPNNYATTKNAPADLPTTVIKPEISSMSADSVYLPLADMSEGHSMHFDFHAMAERVAVNLKGARNVAPEEQASLIKQIWNDLVDDVIGGKKKSNG